MKWFIATTNSMNIFDQTHANENIILKFAVQTFFKCCTFINFA